MLDRAAAWLCHADSAPRFFGHAACAIPSETVTSTGNGPAAVEPASSPQAPQATVGSTITLTGNSAGEKVDVTVVKVIAHARPAGQFDTPDKGKRFVAVQFRLADTGSRAYSDSPSNCTVVIDSRGQQYESWIADVRHRRANQTAPHPVPLNCGNAPRFRRLRNQILLNVLPIVRMRCGAGQHGPPDPGMRRGMACSN